MSRKQDVARGAMAPGRQAQVRWDCELGRLPFFPKAFGGSLSWGTSASVHHPLGPDRLGVGSVSASLGLSSPEPLASTPLPRAHIKGALRPHHHVG